MSLKALSDYTFFSRYARYDKDKKRRETWDEAVDRVFEMHEKRFRNIKSAEFHELIQETKKFVKKKRILGSQRNLQFGGGPIERHELKSYNCTATHINRPKVFAEMMYVLLCGCGAGFSVQKHHAENLPCLNVPTEETKTFIIPDSIEGWADAVDELVSSYFLPNQSTVEFDFSLIRPEGSLIAGQFKAPGPEGLKESLRKIRLVFSDRLHQQKMDQAIKLRPIDAYDIIMHISDAVLSGGVRRSATLCLFSHDDEDMMKAKTGDWFTTNPQRARSNNSAALIKGETTKEEFASLMQSTKEFGEPGFIWLDDKEIIFNPCAEIAMLPTDLETGESGWQSCNLCEINGRFCDTRENFFDACKYAAILGTLQADYTNLNYLTDVSKKIFEKEALLGVSITGIMDNPDILLNPSIQRKGAETCKEWNAKVADMIGINHAARVTCVKPAGSTSCVLGTASGIHPHHAKRYIRRVQANRSEFHVQNISKENPISVEKSVWSANGTDYVISFLCEVPKGAITKNQIDAVDLLKNVRLTQKNWIESGTREERCSHPKMRHNTSNTITVLPDEWDAVEKFIFKNQEYFAGISLLPASGDKDYAQAPFTTVFTPSELTRNYGDASVFASGMIVDGLHAFDNNLWAACDCALGIGEVITEPEEAVEPKRPKKNGYTDKEYSTKLVKYAKALELYYTTQDKYDSWFQKQDWIRRLTQFADRYFESDLRQATYCLKDVAGWKQYVDLRREYKEIDWTSIVEENEIFQNADELSATACSGGKCEIV